MTKPKDASNKVLSFLDRFPKTDDIQKTVKFLKINFHFLTHDSSVAVFRYWKTLKKPKCQIKKY